MIIWMLLGLAVAGTIISVVAGVFIVRDIIHEYHRYETWFREKK